MEVKKIEAISGKFIVDKIKERSKDVDIIYLTEDIILDTNGVKQLAEYVEQLEKENKELKNNNKIIEVNALQVIETNKYLKENSIPKSIIRNKIEELKKLEKNPKEAKHYVAWYSRKIETLQELLGDENG